MKNILSEITLKVSIKHMWLIKLINYPLVGLLGMKPFVPKFCIKVNPI